MRTFILRRLVQAIPVLLITSILVFLLIYLIPGDPATVILGPNATPEQTDALREKMGLEDPLYIQYFRWLGKVLQGDFGVSFRNQYPVGQLIALKLKATIELTIAAALFAVLVAFPLGLLGAVYRGTWFDRFFNAVTGLAYATPGFWIGILLILVFGIQLRWLPASGYASLFEEPSKGWRFIILPAITLGAYSSAVLARFLRSALFEVLDQDFIRTARAKGLHERMILFGHVLKNALIPVVTVLGIQIGVFLGGAVVTEAIFDWPGIGRMLWDAILTRDYTIVQATILLTVSVFVIINLVTDITYGLLDPRIRHG